MERENEWLSGKWEFNLGDIGGGLLFYIHKSLEVEEVVIVAEFQENIFVEIKCNNQVFDGRFNL